MYLQRRSWSTDWRTHSWLGQRSAVRRSSIASPSPFFAEGGLRSYVVRAGTRINDRFRGARRHAPLASGEGDNQNQHRSQDAAMPQLDSSVDACTPLVIAVRRAHRLRAATAGSEGANAVGAHWA